ncbi:type I DNA topoisomerase [soil metagenome]
MRLVVVESPTKARTITGFLPKGQYQVKACMGHVRDLPSSAAEIPAAVKGEKWARLGVNVDDGFAPLYVVPADKKKIVKELKEALKNADELLIATDEDREGESIGWHLLEVLKPKVPVRRMVFHEITRDAIAEALSKTREVDSRLVDAQETRRILDRLVGYTISPLLWKKIAPRLSAGRVQSVAVRLLVQRERERLDFMSASYWDLMAELGHHGQTFGATLAQLGGIRLVSGRDFDENTGKLKAGIKEGKDVVVMSEQEAFQLARELESAIWRVSKVESRNTERKPAAPFITSTLQQEANRKLGLPARRTMQVAQKLYEQGLITYMRTDSTALSDQAVTAARDAVSRKYGKDYLPAKPRSYAGKVRNAQEAHEAIRPSGTEMKTAQELGLDGLEGKLYDLIWKRTVASQMANARLLQTAVEILVGQEGPRQATFRSSGQVIEFPGFFRAYVEGSDDPAAALDDRDRPLPALKDGDQPECNAVDAAGHETKPPARFTDATLVRMLEKEGIGRPSTYASIIDTIVARGYVRRVGNQLIPTFTAFATNALMEGNFEALVDTGFTAEMENVLDDIAAGGKDARPYLEAFFRGKEGIEPRVASGLGDIDARQVSTLTHTKWGDFIIRVGRFGPYVEATVEGEKTTASLPEDLAPADVTSEILGDLLANQTDERVLGIHPEAEQPVLLKKGPYGPYVQLGDDDQAGKPKRMSIPKGMSTGDVTLEVGLGLLSLPRTLGDHPETGKPVKSSIGRFGPYIQYGSTFASLKPEDDVLTVSLDRGLELLAQKQRKNEPLRTLGDHPKTGDPIEVFDGRYGPYVKHQKTNATIPKDVTTDSVTLEQALDLLAAKEKKGPGRKKKK